MVAIVAILECMLTSKSTTAAINCACICVVAIDGSCLACSGASIAGCRIANVCSGAVDRSVNASIIVRGDLNSAGLNGARVFVIAIFRQ